MGQGVSHRMNEAASTSSNVDTSSIEEPVYLLTTVTLPTTASLLSIILTRLSSQAQDNESAVEQAKDEQISDFIRGQYKSATGSDVPIKDKETRLG